MTNPYFQRQSISTSSDWTYQSTSPTPLTSTSFPLTSVSADGDPFCTDIFCQDNEGYDTEYDYSRYGNLNLLVYFTQTIRRSGTLFCTTNPTTDTPYESIGNGVRGFTNVNQIRAVSFIGTPGNNDITGYAGSTVSFSTYCQEPSTWRNGNTGILGLKDGVIVTVLSEGGASFYTNPLTALNFFHSMVITKIEILFGSVPGLGNAGDDITAKALITYGSFGVTDGLG